MKLSINKLKTIIKEEVRKTKMNLNENASTTLSKVDLSNIVDGFDYVGKVADILDISSYTLESSMRLKYEYSEYSSPATWIIVGTQDFHDTLLEVLEDMGFDMEELQEGKDNPEITARFGTLNTAFSMFDGVAIEV
jgi:hypothetical protein